MAVDSLVGQKVLEKLIKVFFLVILTEPKLLLSNPLLQLAQVTVLCYTEMRLGLVIEKDELFLLIKDDQALIDMLF